MGLNTALVRFNYDSTFWISESWVVYREALSKDKAQQFNLPSFLASGNYVVEVKREDVNKEKIFKMMVKR